MSVPNKIGVQECSQCHFPCTKEIFKLSHRTFKNTRYSQDLVFCSRVCLIEYFEIHERVQDKIEKELKKEKSILYKMICPACVRRFYTRE
jgi:hypothetical protein